MPCWAPLRGIIGAFAVVAGLRFVDKVGAGAFARLTVTANFLMSPLSYKYDWLRMPLHA
jgi:transporter family-2 protein